MKFRVKKKYIMLILSAALTALTAYTLAYFTSSDNVTNRFSGKNDSDEKTNVEIEITEHFEPPPEQNDDPFQKTVQISNTGNTDSYIRVRLEFSSSEIRDISWLS
ncbi:MAG: SipW-dependent-type signal peptide-containing protein, partial [Oscillospiraceae bacterium]|nr:SipW-dependent-type signal peptide-containing protein [Oscillospiraceae bacterium]